jgi:hypothetical protein
MFKKIGKMIKKWFRKWHWGKGYFDNPRVDLGSRK